MRYFFSQIPRNIKKIFSGYNLLWHFLAIGLTLIIVQSGFDWKFFSYVVTASWRTNFTPVLILGTFLPILLPLCLLLVGLIINHRKTLWLGAVEAEAAFLGMLLAGFYKAFTGRIQPPVHFHSAAVDVSQLVDISHGFRFGFWRGGVFWGWPSSHTTIAFAMAMAIWAMFPRNKIIRTAALLYALFVGVGVAVTSIHWFSEFVAGAIFGSLIGLTVGKSYLDKLNQEKIK